MGPLASASLLAASVVVLHELEVAEAEGMVAASPELSHPPQTLHLPSSHQSPRAILSPLICFECMI